MSGIEAAFVIYYVCRPENLYKAEDLSTFKSSGDVLLDSCAADSPAQLMLDRISKKVSVFVLHAHIDHPQIIFINKQKMDIWKK